MFVRSFVLMPQCTVCMYCTYLFSSWLRDKEEARARHPTEPAMFASCRPSLSFPLGFFLSRPTNKANCPIGEKESENAAQKKYQENKKERLHFL